MVSTFMNTCVCACVCVCVCVSMRAHASTVEPVYHEHLGTSHKRPDYQGVLIFQVSLAI